MPGPAGRAHPCAPSPRARLPLVGRFARSPPRARAEARRVAVATSPAADPTLPRRRWGGHLPRPRERGRVGTAGPWANQFAGGGARPQGPRGGVVRLMFTVYVGIVIAGL